VVVKIPREVMRPVSRAGTRDLKGSSLSLVSGKIVWMDHVMLGVADFDVIGAFECALGNDSGEQNQIPSWWGCGSG
jgi:hypothetical protein